MKEKGGAMQNFLIKFLLLLSASLSLHSALALPLSSVLASNYHAEADAADITKPFDASTSLNDFSGKQNSLSTLSASLRILLQQEHNNQLVNVLVLVEILATDSNVRQVNTQTLARQSYQEQLTTYMHIQGAQNALYAQNPCYQAKLQHQQKLS